MKFSFDRRFSKRKQIFLLIENIWHSIFTIWQVNKAVQLCDIVRQLRNEKDLSQKQLAQRIGVNKSTVALYESGKRLPSFSKLVSLSRALGVTTDFLLGISDHKDSFLDVSGLTQKQIASLEQIIENYRNCNFWIVSPASLFTPGNQKKSSWLFVPYCGIYYIDSQPFLLVWRWVCL